MNTPRIAVTISFFVMLTLFVTTKVSAAESSQQFIKGRDTLIVYKDVPGLAPSNKYTIRVKSAATNGKWVDCFANYTYNMAGELPKDGLNKGITNFHYQWYTDKWSHTYGNIEMSRNTPVEVEISFKTDTFKIAGRKIFKAAAHPSQKVSKQPVIENGKVYFTIDNPGQVVIDINGQMDDYNAAINPIGGKEKSDPIHTISLFANPVMAKPSLDDPNVVVVEPGVIPSPVLGNKKTLYFKPGVHKIGINFKLYPGKNYYIPGDAIVYGTFNNLEMPVVGNLRSGEDIKIYGYGTISCQGIKHPKYVDGSPDPGLYSPVFITDAMNVELNGITIADPSMHSVKFQVWGQRADKMKKESFSRWVKIISWRANGDGIGNCNLVEDCFLRTADDASYIKGDRIRTIFWRDVHAAGFHMAGIPDSGDCFPIRIEDCDVIYNRSRNVEGYNGGIFHQRAEGKPAVQRTVNVTVRNFRSHDKLSNMPFFNMYSNGNENGTRHLGGSSYKGITFQNISIEAPIKVKQVLTGCKEAPWYGGITFDNVTIGGTLLTQENFTTFFITNEYVKDILFKMPK